jgi:hypothetical protein
MHLFFLNLSPLLISLWQGTIDHTRDDDLDLWPFAVLCDNAVWQAHGAAVADAGHYIPTCVESWKSHNPAEKISSDYKDACDTGGGFFLLGPRELHIMDGLVFAAFKHFSQSEKWQIRGGDLLSIARFAQLLLPNGQIARSLWHEKKWPDEKV